MTYYHGTSSVFHVQELKPACETGNLRQTWRKKDTDMVFFTPNAFSAYKYAVKACRAYGGEPVVYIVKPVGNVYYNSGANEYMAERAVIIGIEKR